jgi:hypothetical protein
MDPGIKSPLIDFFRRGEVARDVRLLAAQGAMAPRAQEQVAILILLSDDADAEVARAADATLAALPLAALQAFLSRPDTPNEMRQFFADRGLEVTPAYTIDVSGLDFEQPLLDMTPEPSDAAEAPAGVEAADEGRQMLSSLSVMERIKLAMKGTREQRSQLVRDSNKLVAAAVLSSPKLNESEVEQFTRMGNVSEDVLRMIGHNRAWTKNYGVVLGLCKHPKTPRAISMQMVSRLTQKDQKMLMIDRNIPEGLRVLARKMASKGKLG